MIQAARAVTILVALPFLLLGNVSDAAAGTMINDPNGFDGVTWGSTLGNMEGYDLKDAGDRITRYERKDTAPALGDIAVDALHFFTVDGKFARVTVRYHGKTAHEQVLKYLQTKFGPIDRTPGQTARGLNQQFNWRGEDTEINVTYQSMGDRGYVFFESRTLSPLFNDMLPEHGY